MPLQRDYLVQMIAQFVQALVRSMERSREKDYREAADTLETAIGEATDIDGQVLLSLTPESIASIMQVSGVEPAVTEYIAASMQLEAHYLDLAGDARLARLRREQAAAVAAAYGFDVPDVLDDAGMKAFLAAREGDLG